MPGYVQVLQNLGSELAVNFYLVFFSPLGTTAYKGKELAVCFGSDLMLNGFS